MFDFLATDGVFWTLIVVVAAIIIDTILGAIRAALDDFEAFDLRLLPKFLATGILPYLGSLLILALAAEFIGDPFAAIFYAAAAAALAKYVAEIKDKVTELFGLNKDDFRIEARR